MLLDLAFVCMISEPIHFVRWREFIHSSIKTDEQPAFLSDRRREFHRHDVIKSSKKSTNATNRRPTIFYDSLPNFEHFSFTRCRYDEVSAQESELNSGLCEV